jgi:hypothetical protein
MKRVAASAIALATSVFVSFVDPPTAEAFPPPCPDGLTFSGCYDICGTDPYGDCQAMAGNPPNCIVTNIQCSESYWCTEIRPWTHSSPDYLLECTYQRTY